MARTYSTLDSNALGPTLELTLGGLVAQSNRDATDIHRMARGTLAAIDGVAYFEVGVWGDGDMANHVSVGIVKGTHALSKYVGEEATGYGYRLGDDGIYHNAVRIVELANVGKKVFVGVLLDFTQSSPTVTWSVQGSVVATVGLSDAGPWYPAVTISGSEAYDLSIFANFGQRAFASAQYPGWYSEPDPIDPIYVCAQASYGFMTSAGDDPPRQSFAPDILNPADFKVSSRGRVWQWERSGEGSNFAGLLLNNVGGKYDHLLVRDMRDVPVRSWVAEADSTLAGADVIASPVIDKVDTSGEDAILISLKGQLATLEEPVQQHLFPPWTDEGVANTPIPISLGAVRNVEGILYDQVNRVRALHDAPITNIAAVRDKGALLDPYSTPPQYSRVNDAHDIALETDAQGLLTVDMSSEGDQVLIPGNDDVLDGRGDFNDWPNPSLPPAHWTHNGGSGNTFAREGSVADYWPTLTSTNTWFPSLGKVGSYFRYETALLLPGKTYRVQFRLMRVNGSPTPTLTGFNFGLMVRSDLSALSGEGAVSPHNIALRTPLPEGKSYTFTYKCPPGASRYLYFISAAASSAVNGVGYGACSVTFDDVKVELMGDAPQALPLRGITLRDYAEEIIETRGRRSSDVWVAADADAIDRATGYRFGVHIRDSKTIRQALNAPFDSFGACAVEDEMGRIRIRRLTDPTEADDADIVAYFDKTNIKRGVQQIADLAPGLTTSIGARPNWKQFSDSDFVTDFIAVPAALRTQFKRRSQFVLTSRYSPADTYGFARNAPPLDSLLDEPADAQIEIDRVMAMYRANRFPNGALDGTPHIGRFLVWTTFYRGSPPRLLFNDPIRITYDRYGLDAGVNVAVIGTDLAAYRQEIQILAWSPQ